MKHSLHPDATASARESWRQPPTHTMNAAQIADYKLRKGALDAYLDGAKVKTITTETGLTRATLVRMCDRAQRVDASGLTLDYYACVKNLRSVRPIRRSELDANRAWRGRGLACAMHQVAHISHEVEAFVANVIDTGKWRNHKARKSVFEEFSVLVHKANPSIDYPFTSPDRGWGSFFRYLSREAARPGTIIDLQTRPRFRPSAGDRSGLPSASHSRHIYDEVELDGFVQPIDMEIILPSALQIDVPLRLEGVGLLAEIERKSTCVIGYYPLLKTSYDSLDLIECFMAALERWVPRQLSIPVFTYKPGAALPSGIHTEACGRLWNLLFWDNHRSQMVPLAREAVMHGVHCDVNAGRAGEPRARPFVERFFGCVSKLNLRGLLEHRHIRPVTKDKSRIVNGAIPLAWVLDLFDIICANYNVTGKKTLHQRSPLDVLMAELQREVGWGRRDTSEYAAWRSMNIVDVRVPIHRLKGRSPYISFESAHYTSEAMRDYARDPNSSDHLDIEANLRDLRDVKAKGGEGLDLGVLHALPPFQSTAPCDLQTRRLIARSMRREGVPLRDINEDLQARFTRNHLAAATDSRSSGSTIATMAVRGSVKAPEKPRKTELVVPRNGWINIDEI